MENLKESILQYLQDHPPALELFEELLHAGDVYLIGGILREYRDKGYIQELRDADFVIKVTDRKRWNDLLEKYQPRKNRFNGFKLICSGLLVDIWELKETWAYREGVIKCDPEEYVKYLPCTVFLNIDAIIYDLKEDVWYDEIYREALKTGLIDIVLEKNPYVLLNIVRAMVLRRKYKMKYSDSLCKLIGCERNRCVDFGKQLLDVQQDRYGKIVLSENEIKQELKLTE